MINRMHPLTKDDHRAAKALELIFNEKRSIGQSTTREFSHILEDTKKRGKN
jgi:hypothetical protein